RCRNDDLWKDRLPTEVLHPELIILTSPACRLEPPLPLLEKAQWGEGASGPAGHPTGADIQSRSNGARRLLEVAHPREHRHLV
ncbi:hypothetical protein, partial [Pseudonocardia sp. H11422]|uniref:hypothetical protein n=1 Tax=Pseudonocardia sp. H11422 TaxID=2835866 RepID=UPI001BDD6C98